MDGSRIEAGSGIFARTGTAAVLSVSTRGGVPAYAAERSGASSSRMFGKEAPERKCSGRRSNNWICEPHDVWPAALTASAGRPGCVGPHRLPQSGLLLKGAAVSTMRGRAPHTLISLSPHPPVPERTAHTPVRSPFVRIGMACRHVSIVTPDRTLAINRREFGMANNARKIADVIEDVVDVQADAHRTLQDLAEIASHPHMTLNDQATLERDLRRLISDARHAAHDAEWTDVGELIAGSALTGTPVNGSLAKRARRIGYPLERLPVTVEEDSAA